MIYLVNQETDPYFNLAFEEYVLKNRRKGQYLLLWRNRPAVVVGRHQNTAEEINRETAERLGIPVVRRETGGGAVYHDLGNLNFSFITDWEEGGETGLERFTDPVARALGKLGIHVRLSGRNDLTIDQRKISGNAQTVYRGRILHHGTLLFDTDLEQAQRVLNVKEDKVQSKSTKSVRSRIANLKDFLPKQTAMDIEGLKTHILREFGAVAEPLKPQELEQVRELALNKYEKWEWNFGESPEFDYRNRTRFAGGELTVGVHVEEGLIREIRFWGDFMALKPVEEIECRLRGVRYNKESIRMLLADVDTEAYFGIITREEIVEGMFD